VSVKSGWTCNYLIAKKSSFAFSGTLRTAIQMIEYVCTAALHSPLLPMCYVLCDSASALSTAVGNCKASGNTDLPTKEGWPREDKLAHTSIKVVRKKWEPKDKLRKRKCTSLSFCEDHSGPPPGPSLCMLHLQAVSMAFTLLCVVHFLCLQDSALFVLC
jgi:hypothetical protein